MALGEDYGGIMAGVAEVEMARLEVDKSEEHGDEHARLVVLAREGLVDLRTNIGRHELLGGKRAEQAGGLGHEQGGGHTLARDIAKTEVELIVLKDIAVEVAADLLGGSHRGENIKVGAVREVARHHAHLDITGNAQVALDALLGGRGLL